VLSRFAGDYQPTGAYSTPEKLRNLPGIFSLSVIGDGELLLSSMGGSVSLVEVEPLVFEIADGNPWEKVYRIVLDENPADGETRLLASVGTFVRTPWYESLPFTAGLMALLLLLFFSVILALPIGALYHRIRKEKDPAPRLARWARWTLAGITLLFVVFGFGFSQYFINEAFGLLDNLPGASILALLPYLILVLSFAAVYFAVISWRRNFWGLAGRIHYSLVTAATVALIWFFFNWKILGGPI
jgi:hypothetical protein